MNTKNAVISIFFAVLSFTGAFAAECTIHVARQTTTVETEHFDVFRNDVGAAVFPAGDLLGKSGEPKIPWKAMRVLLPPDTDMATVSCRMVSAEYKTLDGVWKVSPVPPVLTRDQDGKEIEIWPEDKTIVAGRDTALYSANALWPAEKVLLAGTGSLRSWKLAEISLPLIRYNPVSGELKQLVQAEISVDFDTKGTADPRKALSPDAPAGSRRGHDRVERLAMNFDDAAAVYEPGVDSMQTDGSAGEDGFVPLSPGGTNGYVIITTKDIRANSTKLAAFVTHKETMGFVVTVIDEDDLWGADTPVEGDASATKLREWLQAHYVSMDLKYALIIGEANPNNGYVPMKLYPCRGKNIPTDYFYAELTRDWDKDGDGIIGEIGSYYASSGAEIERYFEVYVGRIPYYGVMADTDAILQKTIDYETATDTDWRRNVLISVNPLDTVMHYYDWGNQIKHNLLDPKVIPSDRAYRANYFFTPEQFDFNPPPEFPSWAYPANIWNHGQYGLHVWATHGDHTRALSIMTTALTLSNNYPTTVFQGACQNAYPEDSGNLSYALLKNGGIVTVGATRSAYYLRPEYLGTFVDSASIGGMGYRYAKGISEEKSCGETLWDMKEEIATWWEWGWIANWSLFNAYGDPSVVVMPPAPVFTVAPTDAFFSRTNHTVGSSASRTYTLKNNSGSPLNWTASRSATWFDLSASGGTIPAGGSTTVDITPNVETAGLSISTHEASATFTDTSNNIVAERLVILEILLTNALKGYWKLDETSGTTAADQSVFQNDGTLLPPTSFDNDSVPGKFGNALRFDGTEDSISIGNLDLNSSNSNTFTLCAWVKPDTSQQDGARIITIFDKNICRFSGITMTSSRELRYSWNSVNYDQWNSGLTLPENAWTFVALVIEPDKATMYMNSGTGFQSAENTTPHAAVRFEGANIGRGQSSSDPRFSGPIDEVRIYDYSMSPADLENLYEGGGAENPSPSDGASWVESPVLEWLPGAGATAHDVYIGTSQAAVAGATKASSEYKKTTTGALFHASLVGQTTYYWRIDTVTALTTLTGSVWTFTTGMMPDPGNIIAVNFEENSNQNFSGGELIGPLALDSTYWNATSGASGSLANLINGIGTATGVDIEWDCSSQYSNNDGTSDDEHKLSVGYLDDGDSGSGNGVTLTIGDIPYTAYKVYGLFASDASSAIQGLDFNVNGTWVYGGSTPSTATVYGSIDLNHTNHGEYWTEINPGTVIGNYWTMVTTGATCTITGRVKNESARGSLAGVIIEKLQDTDGDGIPDDTDTDDDNDGIPDDWENDHGLDPLVDDAAGDPDCDQFDNWFEYITDTYPQDENSKQAFALEIDQGTGEVTARFGTSSSRRYAVEFRDDLTSGAWADLGSDFLGTGSEMTVSDPAAGDRRFYRIRVLLP